MGNSVVTKIKEIGHAVLHVSDVAASSDWYCDILGMEVVIAADGLPARFLSFGRKDHDLALFESTDIADSTAEAPPARGRRPLFERDALTSARPSPLLAR